VIRVQCQKCKAIYLEPVSAGSRWVDPVLVPYYGYPQVTCPECINFLRAEMVTVSIYDTGRHQQRGRTLMFPQRGTVGLIRRGPRGEVFANKPIRKFIRETCCETMLVQAR
jgi:hypothetical protein